jgi:hypothetical protein
MHDLSKIVVLLIWRLGDTKASPPEPDRQSKVPATNILLRFFTVLDGFTLIGAIGILNGTVFRVCRSLPDQCYQWISGKSCLPDLTLHS